jgi:hypothetical protein
MDGRTMAARGRIGGSGDGMKVLGRVYLLLGKGSKEKERKQCGAVQACS